MIRRLVRRCAGKVDAWVRARPIDLLFPAKAVTVVTLAFAVLGLFLSGCDVATLFARSAAEPMGKATGEIAGAYARALAAQALPPAVVQQAQVCDAKGADPETVAKIAAAAFEAGRLAGATERERVDGGAP